MKPSKKLRLRHESMTELTTDELRSAAGGLSGPSCPPILCVTKNISCVDCPSIPLTKCTILTETDSLTCPTDIC